MKRGGPPCSKPGLILPGQVISFPYGLNHKFNVLIIDLIPGRVIFCPGFAV